MGRTEPCDRCGDETAVGSPLFAGRHQGTLEDGAEVFRCGECAARDVAARERDGPGSTTGDWFTTSISGVNVRQAW